MKIKLKQIISIFLIELIILLPIAIADGLSISNVRTEGITDISAKIKWETNNPSEGSVNFGGTKSMGQTKSSPNFVKDHSILLTNLVEDKPYYFEVISNDGTEHVVDNNNGNLYTFTTLPKTPLFVNASIPLYYNQGHTIDIQGKSIRLARVNMYVNNEVPRTLNADNNGNFFFPNIDLNEGNNRIRFTAESQRQIVEKGYLINVDTVTPIVTLSEIPQIIGSERIQINGSVSEPVNISFYVTTGEEDITPPPKITNLRNTTAQANLVELNWDKINISDFEEYVIYRNDKPLGIGSDSTYNDYSDVLANSNQTYIYQVAAMDKSGNIGERSDPLIVKTLQGGRTNLPEEDVDIYEGINKPQKVITTENRFEQDIEIGRTDGFYKIRIESVDKAGNKWVYDKLHLLDTKDPEIKIISPRSNSEIYESYADRVTIRGKTEPGARVYLYVKRTPFGVFDKTWDISGVPNEIQQIPEAELRANCRLEIEGEEQCKTHADYETIADANGYFEFENVDLTSMWAGAFKITEYPTGEPYYELVTERELKDFMESNLFFIAIDPANRRGIGVVDYRIRTCWSTSLTWDVNPLIEYQSPSFLNTERLKEGTEAIYFYFNFTYHGRGIDGKVTNLHVDRACGSGYLEKQGRYNYSCSILRSCTEKLSPGGKTAYVACPLRRLEGIDKWTDDDWKSFIDIIKNEMAFPFKLTMSYDEYFDNKTIERAKSYYLCTEVGYAVDATRINPKEVLPDWLLYDFVDLLNNSISKLNDWTLKLRRVLEWASIGCMATFFLKFVTQIYRRITCHYDRFFKMIGGTLQRIGGEKEQQEDECRQCISEYDPEVLKKFDENKDVGNLISDTCLEICYPSCAGAWKSEENLYKTYRWTCDRVFGHSAPSRWTETATDMELFQKLSQGSGCANDESVRGRPLRAVSCKDAEKRYTRIKGTFDIEDRCLEISTHDNLGGSHTLFHIDGPYSEGENVYIISAWGGDQPKLDYRYVIQQNEDNYLAPMEQSCEEICEGELTGKGVETGLKAQIGDKTFTLDEGLKSEKLDEKNSMISGCVTPNQCVSYRSGEQRTIQLKSGPEQKNVEVKTAVPVGYTRDCFKPEYVSADPDKRRECCCINSQAGALPQYFQPGDIENKDGTFSNQGYEDMRWSYRYYKMEGEGGYKNKRYNPNRYIEGRDLMACFGQNNWLYDGFTAGGERNLLIMDPAKQHISAFQCVAISQILNRLELIKNVMVAMENCLLSIRTTGVADTGVCKEIFTQYICAFVWKIITWIRDGCLPFGEGVDLTKSENRVLEAIGVGTKGIFDSVADSQQELASEYGNAELQNLIGIGEEQVFRKVCLAAFGYDWEIDADSLLDIAYHTPYRTLVNPVMPPSREYLTFDPTNAQAKYEYRASWLINPGCDLDNYEVYLACVTRNDMYSNDDIDCSKQSDPYGKNCDCLDLTPDKAPPPLFYYQSRGRIKQNQLQNVDSSQIQDRIKTSPYRYDHLMFKLRVDRNYIKNKGDVSKCFPDGHEDGVFYFPIMDYTAREFAGCFVDVTTGQFSCKQGASFFYEQGIATIDGVELNNDGSFDDDFINDKHPYRATFYKDRYIQGEVKYSKDKKPQCLVVRLYDENGQPFKEGSMSQTRVYPLRNAAEGEVQMFNTGYRVNEKDFVASGGTVTVTDSRLATSRGLPQTGRTVWKLHIDIRSPKEDNNCENVKGFEYDSSQIVVVDGISQSKEIPILLDSNQRSEDECNGKYATQQILGEECVCGGGYEKNCPEGDRKYCVEDKCRKYPKCGENTLQVNEPCICDVLSVSDPDKYDCGYSEALRSDFEGSDQNAKYCINRQCVTQPTAVTTASAAAQKPVINLLGSRIDQASGGSTYLGSSQVIDVNSKFKVGISVDGVNVDKVVVEIPGTGKKVEIITKNIATNTWDGEINLSPTEVNSVYLLVIYAYAGTQISDKVTQQIKVVKIVQ